jgi:YHS domain-containing protein
MCISLGRRRSASLRARAGDGSSVFDRERARARRAFYMRGTMAVDPVCKMQVDESKAAGKSEYNGKTYYFCAAAWKRKFDENPGQYVK